MFAEFNSTGTLKRCTITFYKAPYDECKQKDYSVDYRVELGAEEFSDHPFQWPNFADEEVETQRG